MNYSFGINPIPQVGNGHVFTRDLFNMLIPHTKICEGITGLKFSYCHLINCDCPPDATFIGREPRHISYCSHLHPGWVKYGLPTCSQTCSHLIEIDTVTIDGQLVDTNYYYQDTENV